MDLPEHVGRLRVCRPLGSGAFATVWQAFDPDLDGAVAIKVLADNWARRADVRERFLTEARLLRRVDSDRVVRVYDVGTLDDGRPYLVMTYADDGCLADRLTAGPLPADEALAVLHQVALGLHVLHSHGIVHRDVNPHNVLLLNRPAPDGLPGQRVLLADLGVAKDLHWASGLTQPAGTGDYRAPEQRQYSTDVGPASDVYALAVLAGALLDDPLPPAARGVVSRAMDQDPAARPPQASDLIRDLRHALASPPMPPPDVVRSPVIRRRSGPGPAAALDPPQAASPAATPGRPRQVVRRGLVAGVAIATVGVVSVGGAAVWGRASTYSSPDDVVAARLTPGWATTSGSSVPSVPGVTVRSSGINLARGDHRVLVAAATRRVPAAGVASAVRHAECGAVAAQSITADDLSGTAFVWSRCPGGESFTEIGLQHPRGTVYVAIAGPGGGPSAEDVLSGLTIRW
ncbi:MAG: protein kinase domain-containing protein [Dermatophilaceae bacterium]